MVCMENIKPQKIAVVTGASRGIGRAIALRLAQDSFTVGVHYGSNREAASQTVADIKNNGGSAFVFGADLASPEVGTQFWASCDEAASDAGIDSSEIAVLVNNAGVTFRGAFEDFEQEDFLLQQAINVNAPYFIAREALPRMGEGGRIINISSGVTRIAFPDIIGYALTKGAINVFTHTLAQHVGSRGITVNAVAPGVVDTDINAEWLRGNREAIDGVSADVALGRIGQPEDIAKVVSFLASKDSGWVTGQVIDATGGTHL